MMTKGILLKDVPLKDYTSLRIGGVAKQLYQPIDKADLIRFLKTLPENEPLLWLGLGSNTLIRDQGFNGTVILLLGCLTQMEVVDEQILRVEAGVSCGTFARFAAKHNLAGSEFLAGIPGTMGGALKMNAGCHGGETWDHVVSVETINHRGEVFTRIPGDFTIRYRHTSLPQEEWFLAANFRFPPGDAATSLEKIRELLARRKATQPINLPNCGSVFRNPPGNFAAKLIEDCGLKGYTLGGAGISEKHANFIINHGHATAADIEALIQHIQNAVKEKFAIELIPEVHIV